MLERAKRQAAAGHKKTRSVPRPGFSVEGSSPRYRFPVFPVMRVIGRVKQAGETPALPGCSAERRPTILTACRLPVPTSPLSVGPALTSHQLLQLLLILAQDRLTGVALGTDSRMGAKLQ